MDLGAPSHLDDGAGGGTRDCARHPRRRGPRPRTRAHVARNALTSLGSRAARQSGRPHNAKYVPPSTANAPDTPAGVHASTPVSTPGYEWLGGIDVLVRLTTLFYSRVPSDPLLAPVFAGMPAGHPKHVAQFLGEVLGGPSTYSAELGGERGGHARMVSHHIGRALSEAGALGAVAARLRGRDRPA